MNHLSPSFGHDPSFPMVSYVFKRPTVRQSVPGEDLPPQTPLRYALHTLPPLRPPLSRHRSFPESCFVGASEKNRRTPRTAPHPASAIMFILHIMAPAPMPLAVAGIKRCPRHSRRFRTPIVVCAAWSFLRDRLTPRPPAARATIVCFSKNKLRPTSRRAAISG